MSLSFTIADKGAEEPGAPPIVVDLDGALLCNPSAHETVFGVLRRGPAYLWHHPREALSGFTNVRSTLAALSAEDAATWPVRDEIVTYLEDQAAEGRKIVLLAPTRCAAADVIVKRYPFISEVICPGGKRQVNGADGDSWLKSEFPNGYTLLGDADPPHALGSPPSPPLPERPVARQTDLHRRIASPVVEMPPVRAMIRCLRLHQWVKNALIFLPAVLDGMAGDPTAWLNATIGFIALSLVASATYVINDLWDLADDRRHWSKRNRPLASGTVQIDYALTWAFALFAIGFLLAASVNWASTMLLGAYVVGTLSYTFGLKRVPILDIMILASLFTLRLGLGMVLTDAKLSYWLLVFSMFVFASLCAAKRHTELRRQIEKGQTESRRGYIAADLPLVLGFGLASMFGAILISVLYLIEDAFPSGFYSDPMYLWLVPFLLSLFLSRIWLLSQRGHLNDDPVAFAVTDRASLVLGILMMLSLVAAFAG